jgi:hypothetical protein
MSIQSLFKIVKKHITQKPSNGDIYTKYSSLTREQNISKKWLVLSFDCDTPPDAEAAEEIADRLKQMGITAVFAVPGKSLEGLQYSYKQLVESGFEFINHGYSDHAAFNTEKNEYYGITWYHEMTEEEVRRDIRDAHECIIKILGISPKGFRAPHFGYFQKSRQLEIIYSEIARLGYTYATTTMPEFGLIKGAVFPVSRNLFEFPLTGTFDNPRILLDSWQFLAAPERVFDDDDYIVQFKKMVDFFSNNDLPCILNFYADPSHVINFRGFFECIDYACQSGIEITTYSRIISILKGN